MIGIAGKVIAITGATSGIGEATAILLAQQGAKVVLAARRGDLLDALAKRISDAGGEALAVITDVRRRADMENLVNAALDCFGKLDVLVNNAGVLPVSALDELRVKDWDDLIDVNIKGVLYGIAAALPVFRKQESGHFINLSSTVGHSVSPRMAIYAGTKFAVRALSEGLRQEAGPNLRVTVVSPGMTDTNFADSITSPEIRAQLSAMREQIAQPPSAIAEAIAYAIGQPANVDVNEILVRPTAQG